MNSNFTFDEEMISFPLEWDDPPHWVKWINDHFNECDYHVHSNNYEPWFNQVQVHLHSWVLAGSWLYKARRVRAFSHHFDSWQQFCEKALNSCFTNLSRIWQRQTLTLLRSWNFFVVSWFDPAQSKCQKIMDMNIKIIG